MREGRVIRIVHKQGFGFIAPSNNTADVFFHSDSVGQAIFQKLNEGQKVEFEVEADPTEPTRSRASFVRLIGG